MSLPEFSDTSSFSPCRRCSELLQEGDRFCRFCGEDQLGTHRRGARAPIEADFADTLQPEEQMTIGHLGPTNAANEEVRPEPVPELPEATGPKGLSGRGRGTASSAAAYRSVVGMLALVVLLVLPLGHDLQLDQQRETSRLPAPRADGEQTQSASIRGDLNSAGRALEEQRVQAAKREQLRNTAMEVSRALGLGEPAAQSAQAPSPPTAPVAPIAPLAVIAPTVATPAPAIGVAEPKEEQCNPALAALAMCPQPPASPVR